MEKREKKLWKQPRWSTIKIVRGLGGGGGGGNSKFKKILQENSSELIERARRADRMEEDRLTQALACRNSTTRRQKKGPLRLQGRKRKKGKTGLEVSHKSHIPLDIQSNDA